MSWIAPVQAAKPSPPTAPSNLRASTVSSSQINLTWQDNSGNESGFIIQRAAVSTGPWSQIATSSKNTTSYSNTGLSAGTTYYYRVCAYNSRGSSAYSAVAGATTTSGGSSDTTAPSVPAGLTATAASSSQINLSWSPSSDTGGSGLAGYRIYRNGSQIATTAGTSYSSSGLAANTTYCYTVAAYDAAGNTSAQSAQVCRATLSAGDTTAPSAPSGLAATAASSSQINLSWNASSDTGGSGLAGYKIFRGGVQIATTAGTSYSNTGLSAGVNYCYSVAAYDAAGNTSAQSTSACATTTSGGDTTPPSTPTGLTATAASSSQINLSWSPSTDSGLGMAGYKVYRNGALVAYTASTSYANTGLSSGVNYCYTVAAYDAAGNTSAQSAQACRTTLSAGDATAPSAPTGLTATAASSSQINLSWSASSDTGGSGLAGYKVFRSGVQIATTAGTSYSNSGLSANSSYCYTVAAYDGAGNTSAQSAQVCRTTLSAGDTTAPSTPSGLTATAASSSQINLSWSASSDTGGSGLAGYKIFRGGVQIATTAGTSYSNAGLAANSTYCYTVAAYDAAGNTSAQSAQVCRTTLSAGDTTAPSTPSGLTATAASSSQINLSWSASSDTGGSGLAGYKVFRNGTQIATTAGTSYSSTGLSAGANYCYTVAAYDGAGNTSGQSAQACATTQAAADTTPPSATLTSPAASSTVSGTISVAASASDNVGVARVEFYRDGTLLIASDPASPYSSAFDTTTLANGSHSFSCKAYDAANNWVSSSVTVNVSNSGSTAGAWVKRFGGSSGDSGNAVAVAGNGDVIVAGYFQGSIDLGGGILISAGGSDIFLARYTAAGAHLWSKRFGAAGSEMPYCIALDASGNIFLGGGFTGAGNFGGANWTTTSSSDAFVAKYSPQGDPVWSQAFGATSADAVNSIATDSQGNVVIAGYFLGAANLGSITLTSALSSTDAFLAKYSSAGVILWAKTFPNGGSSEYGTGVAVDKRTDNIVLTGRALGDIDLGGGRIMDCGFLAKFLPTGEHVWSRACGVNNIARPWTMALDSNGDVAISGDFRYQTDLGGGVLLGTATYLDMFLAKYSGTDGRYLWARIVTGNLDCTPKAMIADAQNNLIIAGSFRGTFNFGAQSLTTTGTDWSIYDGFVAKYAAAGTPVWARQFGGTGYDYGYGTAVDSSGYPVVTGIFEGTATFNGQSVTSAGATDVILGRMNP